jgi:hypothetical protein
MEARKPMLNKWKRAVLHLEGAADSVDLVSEELSRHAERLRAGELTPKQLSDILSHGQRDLRYQGTAIFIIHAKRRYLITARHVVWDETSAKREVEKAVEEASRKSGDMRLLEVQMAKAPLQRHAELGPPPGSGVRIAHSHDYRPPFATCPRRDHRQVELEKQSGADAKELAEFSRLRRADAALPGQSLMHMAALSENAPEIRCRFPGVLQEELEPFGGGAIVRRECVPAVVVLDQQGQ